MNSISLYDILKANRQSIFDFLCSSLGESISNDYHDFVLNTTDGQRRLSIYLDLVTDALNTSPVDFYQDQQKVGYCRALQGYSLGNLVQLPKSLIEAISIELYRKYYADGTIPYNVLKDLINVIKIVFESTCIVANSYIVTREERIAAEIDNMKRLHLFTKKLIKNFNLEEINGIVSNELRDIFGSDISFLVLSNEGKLENPDKLSYYNKLGDIYPLIEKVWQERNGLYLAEENEAFYDIELHSFKRLAIIPIQGNKDCHGVAVLASFDKGFYFTKNELFLLNQFLLVTAIAIENCFLFSKLQISRDKMNLLTRKILNIREEERQRLAEDIHDSLIQTLTGMSYKLEYYAEASQQTENSLHQEIKALIPIVQEAIHQSRGLTSNLHPDLIGNVGLASALERLICHFRNKYHLTMDFIVPEEIELSSPITIAIYRAAQEALSNIVKHSCADKVSIKLKRIHNQIILQIVDNGQGFDSILMLDRFPFQDKFGLFYIQQRVESLGGKLSIKSSQGSGCSIRVTFSI